jgi:plasmid stabilization system protein ParE
MRYRVSNDAERDLDEIFLYWAKRASLEVADRVIDSITERFWLLGEHPDAGKPVIDVAPRVKCFPRRKVLNLLPQNAPRHGHPPYISRRSGSKTRV